MRLSSSEESRKGGGKLAAAMDKRRPIDHLVSIRGYERVRNTLVKIEYGMY